MLKHITQPSKTTDGIMWSRLLGDYQGPIAACARLQENMSPGAVPSSGVGTTACNDFGAFDDLVGRSELKGTLADISTGFYQSTDSRLVNAHGDADLLALAGARVYCWGHAKISASGDSCVVATDQAQVTASDTASVLASGCAKVYATDDALVAAMDSSEVYASGRVKIKAFGFARIYASGDSVVEVAVPSACSVFLYGNARLIAIDDRCRGWP